MHWSQLWIQDFSLRGGRRPFWGAPTSDGHFSVETWENKELGPVGAGGGTTPLDPPVGLRVTTLSDNNNLININSHWISIEHIKYKLRYT